MVGIRSPWPLCLSSAERKGIHCEQEDKSLIFHVVIPLWACILKWYESGLFYILHSEPHGIACMNDIVKITCVGLKSCPLKPSSAPVYVSLKSGSDVVVSFVMGDIFYWTTIPECGIPTPVHRIPAWQLQSQVEARTGGQPGDLGLSSGQPPSVRQTHQGGPLCYCAVACLHMHYCAVSN